MYEQRFVFQPKGKAIQLVDFVTKKAPLSLERLTVLINGMEANVFVKRGGYIVGPFHDGDEITLIHPFYKRETFEFTPALALLPNMTHPERETTVSCRTDVPMTLLFERQWVERQRSEDGKTTTVYTLQANYFAVGERWISDERFYRVIAVDHRERSFTVTPTMPTITKASAIFTEVEGHVLLPRHYAPTYSIVGRVAEQQQVKEVTARQRDIVTFQWQDGN